MNCTVQFMDAVPVRTPAQALAVPGVARDAFTAGLGPAMFTGAGVALTGVGIALTLAPRRIKSDDSGDQP